MIWDWLIDKLCRALCRVFWWRFRIIPHALAPDVPLLRQLLLWKSAKLEIYLQHFDTPENLAFVHCHEWPRMRSVVLSGSFIDERFPVNAEGVRQRVWLRHESCSTYTMDATVWHRTEAWEKRCWTLFFCMGGRTIPRGYREITLEDQPDFRFRLGPFIPWREHIVKQVPSLTGIRTP